MSSLAISPSSAFSQPFHPQSEKLHCRKRSFSISSGGSAYARRRGARSVTLFAQSPRAKESEYTQSVQSSEEDNKASLLAANGGSASRLLSFLCPLLKFFGGGDPSQERNELLEVATSSLSSFSRFPWGSRSLVANTNDLDATTDLQIHLQIYEFEACPFCRRVREAMTELDLSAELYPCPKGSTRHREVVRRIGGKEQFPFLVDLKTGISMYESGDIVKYLFQQYGDGRSPTFGILESTLFTGWMPTLLRAGRGMTLWNRAGSVPSRMLELFSYENNAHSRIVREALSELELPYILHNVGQGSTRSELLTKKYGTKEVPYLIDPNTGVQLSNYKKIIQYLFQQYCIDA